MREWERKIVDIIRGWCPKVKEQETSLFSLARALKMKEVMRKNIHLAAIVVATTIVTSLLLVSLYLSYPVAPPLKQNISTKTFTDSRHLVSLDIIIYYETELDGTWRTGLFAGKEYNVTILLKPTFINTSAVSMLRLLQCNPYFHPECVDVMPAYLTPLEYGIDLYPYWTNNTTCVVASWVQRAARVTQSLTGKKLDYFSLTYHFVFRLIQTDATREIFVAGDTIRIPIR